MRRKRSIRDPVKYCPEYHSKAYTRVLRCIGPWNFGCLWAKQDQCSHQNRLKARHVYGPSNLPLNQIRVLSYMQDQYFLSGSADECINLKRVIPDNLSTRGNRQSINKHLALKIVWVGEDSSCSKQYATPGRWPMQGPLVVLMYLSN